MNFLTNFPEPQELLHQFPEIQIMNVNAHIHTPFSFSAFEKISEIFQMAVKEQMGVVGINDFFVADGYEAFYDLAKKYRVFPLFNIEFVGLLAREQREGIRINDPNNAGRCYFCGKGLNYPFEVDAASGEKLLEKIALSQNQIRAMIDKLNDLFSAIHSDIKLNYNQIRVSLAKNLVRERHLAKAVRIAVLERYPTPDAFNRFLTGLMGGKMLKSAFTDKQGIENEIRSNLLKSGGQAFVEEDESSFLKMEEIKQIIINAGGIPCYPMLLDDKNGNYTEFEKSPEHLYYELCARNISCIEAIPGRNDAEKLEEYLRYFYQKGFVILLGTEHNTPDMIPLTCDTRGKQPLNKFLKQTAYEGACVVAAHQYLRAKGELGYISQHGTAQVHQKNHFIKLGNAVIHYFQTM